MRIDCKVMAHPSRADAVAQLLTQLDRDVEVIWDKPSPASSSPRRRWAVGKRAWQAIDRSADYGLVLQDDVVVAQDLLAGAEKALDQLGPEGLVSFYAGTGRPHQANVRRAIAQATRHSHTWWSTRSLMWGPAICLPTHTIDRMLAWSSRAGHGSWPYDYRIGVYYRDVRQWRTWYTLPSLVQTGHLPSLIGNDTGPKRQAHQFLGTDQSALGVDWAAHPEPHTPGLPS